MRRQELPDPLVKDAADQYYAAALVLEPQGPESGVLLPLLNNLGVAVELYLKALSSQKIYDPVPNSEWSKIHAKPHQGGHELEKILKAIPDEVRDRLTSEFANQNFVALDD